MILKQLNPAVLETQADFIRLMNANRDFAFWGETLIPEETKELRQAHTQEEGMEQIFKEAADLIYVMCGFFNVMPKNIYAVIDNDRAVEIINNMVAAEELLAMISNHYKISAEFLEKAFYLVHQSNLSKLGDDGKPILREDGKVMKGPNYKKPNMTALVEEWQATII